MEKRNLVVFSLLLLLSVGFVSAGIFDIFQTTGKATSQPTNVSLTVIGTNAVSVGPIEGLDTNYNPTENGATTITFFVTVTDADGATDINDSSINVDFTRTGETTRSNSSCALVGDISSTAANYTCSVAIYYWDGAGAWNLTVGANDLGNQTEIFNTSESFTYNELKAMTVSPSELTWASMTPGDTNQTSNNDATYVNNTGNYNGTLDLTGLDLLGETTSSEIFAVGNFTVDVETGSELECDGNALVNNSLVTITNSIANRGNLSLGSGVGQEELYYCIPTVPLLSSQTYSTDNGGSWTISY